jgi:putative Mn2+ efflux pump MntP
MTTAMDLPTILLIATGMAMDAFVVLLGIGLRILVTHMM